MNTSVSRIVATSETKHDIDKVTVNRDVNVFSELNNVLIVQRVDPPNNIVLTDKFKITF